MIHADGIIRPYQLREAEGNQILQDVNKGKLAKTDTYVAHLVLDVKELKYILLVTDKRIVMVNKGKHQCTVFTVFYCTVKYGLKNVFFPVLSQHYLIEAIVGSVKGYLTAIMTVYDGYSGQVQI